MAKVTLHCSECATELAVEDTQLARATEKGIACPLCGIRLPVPAGQGGGAGPEKMADGMFRIRCSACSATLNVTEDALKKLAGKSINCLKCDAEIKISDNGTVVTPPPAKPPAQPPAQAAVPAPAQPVVQPPAQHGAKSPAQHVVQPAPAKQGAAAPPAAQKGGTIVLPPPSIAARQAESAARMAAAGKKCFTCGKALETGEDALCTACKQKQTADRLVMNVPAEGRIGPKTVKLKIREEQPPPMRTCIKCQAEFLAELNVCPACNIDQTTGKKTKQKRVTAVWPQPGAKRSRKPGGKFLAKLTNFSLKLLTLAALSVLIYFIYKYIMKEYRSAEVEYNRK